MWNYDSYLAQCVEDYMERVYCEPKVISVEKEYEGPGIMPSDSYVYNCHECNNKECEYWEEYNG